MRRILVTGANGFVGSALCDQLIVRGFSVRAALRCGCCSAEHNGLEVEVVGDVGPDTNWEKALAEVDCVVHLAARVHVMADQAVDPLAEFRLVNKDGTVRLAKQAALCGVRRFIYLSSIKVNGEETTYSPFTADDPPHPLDPYSVSKAEAEEQLLEMSGKVDMEMVVIRPPLVYGPGVKANFYELMQLIAKGVPLPTGAIYNKRSLVGIGNLVDLIVTCIDHPAAANQVFLAGDGTDLSTSDLMRRLGILLGKPARLIPVPHSVVKLCLHLIGKGDVAQKLCGSLQVDISKTRDLLDWRPPLGVDEALAETARDYLRERADK